MINICKKFNNPKGAIYTLRTCIVCRRKFEHWGDDVCSIECSNELEH